MKITANSKDFEIQEALTVAEFITRMALNPARCVVELNSAALRFEQFKNITLKDGDNLEIMQVVAGG